MALSIRVVVGFRLRLLSGLLAVDAGLLGGGIGRSGVVGVGFAGVWISVPGMRAGWGTSSGTLRVPGESAPNLKSSDSQLPPPPTADLNDKPLTKLNKPLTKLNKA